MALGLGINPKGIPPWPNKDEQKRIEEVGQKLVPKWMGRLAVNDPSRVEFRFQLTDGKRWPWILALPSGIILVPHEVVERLQNDSQLAEVLADAIACVLEKQKYRARLPGKATTVDAIESRAEFATSPASGLGMVAAQAAMVIREEHQSSRVSLDLMNDAGFDVHEAPVAWWLLEPRKPEPVTSVSMPNRAAYLYRLLGEVWAGKN